ncbi:Rz1-like lysis system protein LysC [Lysobacter sp. F6437]|uniref:Rz1-like lysis system protein LysC n=1 Tax=Lysobacter sp. F6437 TaxID=3459296 RepID=UPI00403E0A09
MLRPALILALLALTACQTCPEPPLPEKVYITVEKLVEVPEELTRPCDVYQVKASTYGEAIIAANKRKASLEACNARLKQIRGLTP